ncbi:putative cysteine-rich repeat secretory protein 5 [Brassica napus]|uniref:putative cysteine-rich repeat secretory protein 5 n=1 Tax=Brassica napus TaxID=3708 RepID=UPI0006AAB3F2|nr:putative cysteine-rich repeat secretory protein 5 [Brassica napus]
MTRIITHFAIVLVCFFLLSLQTMSQSVEITYGCNQTSTTFNNSSAYRSNLETVLSTLRDRSSLGSYANTTAGLSPNTVYGMFLCRGDINRASCSNCVRSATSNVGETCNSDKGNFIFYDECIVRYSNFSFFTLFEDGPAFGRFSMLSSSEYPEIFNQTLSGILNELILRASSSSSSPIPYFVEDQEHVTQLESSYDLKAIVQCSPDLDPRNCTLCLRRAVQYLSGCCGQARVTSANILFPKCLLNYNISALQRSRGVING